MKMGITTCLKETANIPNQISTLYFLLGILLALMLASGENISTYSTVGTEAVTSVNTTADVTQQPTGNTAVSLTTSSVPSGSITVPTSSSSSVSSTYTMFTNSLNTTNALTATNVTTESFGSMSMISCPAFTCNFSDCYTMFTNENATTCRAAAYCELIRQEDMGYSVNCTTACAKSCVNTSWTNCSVKCCNATGCLNDTFVSMMMGTITEGVTSNVPDTTPTTTGTKPTMENSNKCHAGTCIGVTCYTDFAKNPPQSCSASQAHCQLMKETMNSNTKWTAGCTTNCSGKTTCKATTPPPCYLECCNTTLTSCLWLNGTLNVFSSAERIFHLNAELVASFLCVFAISLVI